MLKNKRIELGYTQEKLSEGICDTVTLSRIENGRQIPSKRLISALMQRLGMPDDRIFAFVSENEIEIEKLQKEIISLNVKYSRTSEDEADLIKRKLLEKIDILKKKTDDDDNLIRQFIMRIEFGLNKEKSIDD